MNWTKRGDPMTTVYVVQTGQTTLEEDQRLESAAGGPLTDQGQAEVLDAARALEGYEIKTVYACTVGEGERQTAELMAAQLKAKVRDHCELHEIDYGLWQGLTTDEIKRRQPRVYRQWTKAPASVRPPEGETLAEAQHRLKGALKEIVRRHKNGTALLVLRPVLMGLLKCLAENGELDDLWAHVDLSFRWGCYDVDDQSL